MRQKVIVFLGIVAAVSVGVFFVFSSRSEAPTTPSIPVSASVSIDDVPIRVAVADTDALRSRGLGGYAPLESNEGMLFVFPEDGRHAFWMKDMAFAIDMLWLDIEGRVVDIKKGVVPETFPEAFTPDAPARYVLEVPAGFCDMHDIAIGDRAILP